MGSQREEVPDWERPLAAERHLQHLVPGAVMVGGAAAAIHAGHRVSVDADHVLETVYIAGLRVPTLGEMARIKAWLLVTRYTVRDYLDTVVLLERLGEDVVDTALRPFDDIYRQASGASPLSELSERLAAGEPRDRAEIDLSGYRGLRPPWNDWQFVTARGRRWAPVVARVALEEAQ